MSILDELIADISWLEDVRYFYISSLTYLVYDTVLCFPDELKYIWSKPKVPITWLYCANRYIAILTAVLLLFIGFMPTNDILCKHITPLYQVLNAMFHLFVNCTFVIRLMALYSDQRKMKMIIFGTFIAAAITAFVIGLHSLHLSTHEVEESYFGIKICYYPHLIRAEFGAAWIIIMTTDIFYSILAVYKAAIIWRETTGLTGAELALTLIRDQAVYFTATIWIGVINVIYFSIYTGTGLSLAMVILGNPCLLSPFAARCVLNMKRAGDKGGNPGTNYVLSPLSTAQFATGRGAPSTGVQDGTYISFKQGVTSTSTQTTV